MSYRQTFVIEYADASNSPSVGAGDKMLGGTLVAVQFSDALAELSALIELAGPEMSSEAWMMASEAKG